MSIFSLLDRGGRETLYGSGFSKGHLGKGGLDTEASPHAQSRQKSYADRWQQPLVFDVGDRVFLKVMHKRGVVNFGERGKLSLRYIGPFKVLERVGTVAYRLALPPSLSGVHAVFYVSMLRKYTLDLTHVVDWGELVVDADGTFNEGPVRIMDSRDQVL